MPPLTVLSQRVQNLCIAVMKLHTAGNRLGGTVPLNKAEGQLNGTASVSVAVKTGGKAHLRGFL